MCLPVGVQDVYYVGTSGLKVTELDGLAGLPNLQVRRIARLFRAPR